MRKPITEPLLGHFFVNLFFDFWLSFGTNLFESLKNNQYKHMKNERELQDKVLSPLGP